MNAALIAQLIIVLGPQAISLIQELVTLWDKPVLTTEEVLSICSKAQKSYDSYIKDATPNV